VSRAWRIAGAVLFAWAACAAPALATLQQRLMEEAGIDPVAIGSLPSIRLEGLGGMHLGILDEGNELNAHDFGGSVSGVLEDADGWTIDGWGGSDRLALEQGPHSFERGFGHSGLQVIKRAPRRALGLDANWSFWDAPNAAWTEGKVSGPRISALLNQQIGRFTLGGAVGLESEEERRDVEDFFAIQHKQDRVVGQLGGQVRLDELMTGLQAGATWDFDRGDIEGKSEDPARFHQDDYTWSSPGDRFSVFLLMRGTGALEGGVRASYLSRDGSERVLVSWSDRSPRNPSRTNYRDEAVTFWEKGSDWQASTCWRWHMNSATILGFEAGFRQFEHEVEEGINYKGSLRAGRTERKTFSAGFGASRLLLQDRLLAAAEAHGILGTRQWDDDGTPLEADERDVQAAIGLEYFAARSVVLRGAVYSGTEDEDVDAPLSMNKVSGVSAGASWLPRGGTIQFHAALRYERISRDAPEALSLEKGNGLGYSIGMRLLP